MPRHATFKAVAAAAAASGVVGIVIGVALNVTPRQPSERPAADNERVISSGVSTASPSGTIVSAGRAPSTSIASTPASDAMTIDIPAIGVKALSVVTYEGSPDDEQGTAVNDSGPAANPLGTGGGVSPGEVGNVILTGHRTAAGAPFLQIPQLRPGDHALVSWRGHAYDYQITGQLTITFHDPASYALQVAPVPGHPAERPTQSMLTLSTCATPEDNAAGHRERDAMGNPPHRIDAIGVLVAVT